MGKGQEGQKEDLLTTFSMAEAEWAEYNVNTQPIFSSPNSAAAGTIEVDALDQRLLRKNPLKHAAIEAVARVSVLRTLDRSSSSSTSSVPASTAETAVANGSDYLLTSLTLFTLYEPCIYCTMALLHSPRFRTLFPPP